MITYQRVAIATQYALHWSRTMAESFVVASVDEPLSERKPVLVTAVSAEAAIQRYLTEIYAQDVSFREWVLERDLAFSFIAQLANEIKPVVSPQRVHLEQLRVPLVRFFCMAPTLGLLYQRYLETGDRTVVTDEVFQFIAKRQGHGFIAFNIDEILAL
jgi:hypothetical protein